MTLLSNLKGEQKRLAGQLEDIGKAISAFGGKAAEGLKRRGISAAGQVRIAVAQRARWAKVKWPAKKN